MKRPSVLVSIANPQVGFLIAADLARRGVRVEAAGDSMYAACRFSRHIERFHIAPPVSSNEAYVDFVCRVCTTQGIDLFLPACREVFDLAPFRERLRRETRYPFPDCRMMELVNDKCALSMLACQAGLNTPASATCTGAAWKDLRYPIVRKPKVGFGAHGFRFLDTEGELNSCIRGMKDPDQWVFQEFIPGPLMVWMGIRWKGQLRAAFAFETIRTTPAFGGASVLRRSVIDTTLNSESMRLLDFLGYEGLCTLDYIRGERDGKPYLIDFNPRFGTSLHAALAAGVSFPHCLLKLALDEEFDPPAYEEGIVSSSLAGHIGRMMHGCPRRPPLHRLLSDAAQAFFYLSRAEEFYAHSPLLFMLTYLPGLRGISNSLAGRKEHEDVYESKSTIIARR